MEDELLSGGMVGGCCLETSYVCACQGGWGCGYGWWDEVIGMKWSKWNRGVRWLVKRSSVAVK